MLPIAFDRSEATRRLSETTFDVVIVGGGITGVGCALDAAARGLRTALVERDDFASGTSSKSSKLVHGGLRYLQQGDVRLVYEALAERQRLRHNAPHLVKVLPFLLPMFKGRDGLVPAKLARTLGAAMWAYDLTGGARIGKLHKRISAEKALAYMPTLPADRLASSYLYYDAQADDARLTLAVARTAAVRHGAVVVNRAELAAVCRDGDISTLTVRLRDGDTTRDVSVRTAAVVNAAGVWADDVRALDEGAHPDTIRPAKGIHITVPWSKVRNEIAAVIPVPKDRRSVFVVPWGDFTYVGTTDTDYDGPVDDPQCTSDDVDYLLRALNHSVGGGVERDDVLGTWAGLRPLVKSVDSGRTADLSRRHKVVHSANGVVTVTGGKLTTYREMAADTVDHLLAEVLTDPGTRERVSRRSPTKHLRLCGTEGYAELLEQPASVSAHLTAAQVIHLADRFGDETHTVAAMVDADPTLGEPLVAGLPYLRAEALFAVRYEMATTVDDVLTRRTRARLLLRDASAAAAESVADLIGDELGWDADERERQVEDYRAQVRTEREAPGLAPSGLVPAPAPGG
ncbi:MAG: glycerol-3-phosphate dehydrogenase/oxidase [Acidimicrobiia bacterium]|nr:glycerol-3-phosphate dehydrogenase/oxidase [Acidimicrobiia bacterium]